MVTNLCLTIVAFALGAAPGDRAFEQLADEYLVGHLEFRPHVALELGIHDYDGKLADYRPAVLERLVASVPGWTGLPLRPVAATGRCDPHRPWPAPAAPSMARRRRSTGSTEQT